MILITKDTLNKSSLIALAILFCMPAMAELMEGNPRKRGIDQQFNLTPAAKHQRRIDKFNAIDLNKDGKIDSKEISVALQEEHASIIEAEKKVQPEKRMVNPNVRQHIEQRSNAILKHDSNRDGFISIQEFMSYHDKSLMIN